MPSGNVHTEVNCAAQCSIPYKRREFARLFLFPDFGGYFSQKYYHPDSAFPYQRVNSAKKLPAGNKYKKPAGILGRGIKKN